MATVQCAVGIQDKQELIISSLDHIHWNTLHWIFQRVVDGIFRRHDGVSSEGPVAVRGHLSIWAGAAAFTGGHWISFLCISQAKSGSSLNLLHWVCFSFLDLNLNLNSGPLLTLTIDSCSTSPIFLDNLFTFFHILSQKFSPWRTKLHPLDRLLLHLRAEDGEVSN